jgi:hypothetical protein
VETAEERHFVNKEVEKWVRYGTVREVAVALSCCCLPVGVVQGEKLGLIWDGRYLNCWTPSPAMEYERLLLFQKGILVGAWVFLLDHKAGYQHVPLAEDSKQYSDFRWGGQYYQFKVLPFGWAPACFISDTMSGVLASWFRRMKLH